MTRPQLTPAPLREPATLLARPSALAFTRFAWAAVAALLPVVTPPAVGQWCPWWTAPLLASCLVDAGMLCALMWGLTVILLAAVLPPGGGALAPQVVALLAALAVRRRARELMAATAWAPALLGAGLVVAHDVTLVVLDAAASGRLQVDAIALLVRAALTAILCALVVPAWVGWAGRERSRGRA